MDSAKKASKLLQKNWKKFGSFRVNVTYVSCTDKGYDLDSGDIIPPSETSYPLSVIFAEFGYTQRNAAIRIDKDVKFLAEDMNMIFPAENVTFVPKRNDYIINGQRKWFVVASSSDPKDFPVKPIHHELHVRPLKS